jgi:hypothetical protein
MDVNEISSVLDLDQAVRLFHKLMPPKVLDDLQPPTTATVYTPWIVSWLMVYQRLNGSAILADAVGELARMDDDLLPDNKRTRERSVSFNTGGYSRARDRMKVEVAETAADAVVAELIAQSPPSLGGQRTFLIDGSTLSLAPTAPLRNAFPPAKNQHGESHWPVLRLVTAHELSSGTSVRPEIGQMCGPKAIGEVALAAGLIVRLPPASILIGDRNFGIFAFAWLALGQGHDILMRLTKARFQSMVRKAKLVGPRKWKLTWKPSNWDRKQNLDLPADAALELNLHEVVVSKHLTLWLVTSLDESGVVLADLYHGRQNIETDLRDLKQTLRLEEIRGKSPEMVRKELAAATIAYNLVVTIRRLAAVQAGVEPRRLSFSRIRSLVKVLLLQPREEANPEKVKQRIDEVLRMAGQCKLPNRPGRNYPREVITKRGKFPRKRPKNESNTTK